MNIFADAPSWAPGESSLAQYLPIPDAPVRDLSIRLRKDPEKFSYDKWTASLTSTTRRFQLHQAVRVDYQGADSEKQYQAQFTLREGLRSTIPYFMAELSRNSAPSPIAAQ